jgi:hypothetical protein
MVSAGGQSSALYHDWSKIYGGLTIMVNPLIHCSCFNSESAMSAKYISVSKNNYVTCDYFALQLETQWLS